MKVFKQIVRFGIVGVVATGVHMMVGLVLIHSGWHALSANALAFVVAFLVSFVGHFGYSFADQNTDFTTSLWKFIIVGSSGFLFNEAILSVLLHTGLLTSAQALFTSTMSAAALTFTVSRCWAFQGKTGTVREHTV